MDSSPPTQSSSTLPNSTASTIPIGSDSQLPQTQPLFNQPQDPSTSTSSIAMHGHADAILDADLDATFDTGMDVDSTAPPTRSEPLAQAQLPEQNGAAALGGEAGATTIAPAEDVRVPQKKDISLREFLSKMDEYGPIIPDAITTHYLLSAGLPAPPTTPLPLARLLALATQKFVADIAADAYQYARIRSSNSSSANALGAMAGAAAVGAGGGAGGTGGGAGDKGKAGGSHLGIQRPGYGGGGAGSAAGGHGAHGGKTILTMEDLGMAVGEYGVSVRRGEFYR